VRSRSCTPWRGGALQVSSSIALQQAPPGNDRWRAMSRRVAGVAVLPGMTRRPNSSANLLETLFENEDEDENEPAVRKVSASTAGGTEHTHQINLRQTQIDYIPMENRVFLKE
jgi:hypothetical protein